MLTRTEGADHPVVDEDVVPAGQRDEEGPVCVPTADDLLTGGHGHAGTTVADGLNDRIWQASEQRHTFQHAGVLRSARAAKDACLGIGGSTDGPRHYRRDRCLREVFDNPPHMRRTAGGVEDAQPDGMPPGEPSGARSDSCCPQERQNGFPGVTGSPHDGHSPKGVPQSSQNRSPSPRDAPHRGHVTTTPLYLLGPPQIQGPHHGNTQVITGVASGHDNAARGPRQGPAVLHAV
jgi:hypothetical protein